VEAEVAAGVAAAEVADGVAAAAAFGMAAGGAPASDRAGAGLRSAISGFVELSQIRVIAG